MQIFPTQMQIGRLRAPSALNSRAAEDESEPE